MSKYYTRACNFYYGKTSLEMLKKKKAFPLNGNKEVSFDTIEILSRKDKKKIKIDKIKSLNNHLKKKGLACFNKFYCIFLIKYF